MVDVNPIKGETSVKVGDVEIVMAVTMDGLARLSKAAACDSLHDLYRRLSGGELTTAMLAVRLFTIRGTDAAGKSLKGDAAGKAALDALTLTDMAALQIGFVAILEALVRKPGGESDEGKQDAPTH